MVIKDGILATKIGSATFVVDFIPISNKTSRPQLRLVPEYITIHNTGNSDKTADARMHTKYVDNTKEYISWHFTVDDKSIYQELPTNEVGWHCSNGNQKSIGIEICETGDFQKAKENAVALVKILMKKLNIPLKNVVPHQYWTGKYCPRLILDEGWDKFIGMIEEVNKPLVTYGYSKLRFKNHTDVHIFSSKDIPQVVFGQRKKQEFLTDIVKQYVDVKCAINCGMFAFDGKTEHYGLLITDNGKMKKIKGYYQPSSKNFVDMIAWKDGRVSIKKKNGYDAKYLVGTQQQAHWGIGTSYALMINGKESTLNWDKFAHSQGHHNRTIIGYNSSTKVWYLIVADGRTKWDKGLKATEQVELCKMLNITDACNLDGGGSSDMICNGKVVTGDYRVSRKIGTAIIV